jgi:hypothetical protein
MTGTMANEGPPPPESPSTQRAGTSRPADPNLETIAALAALPQEQREILLRVAEILDRLRFGTVLLVVQDGKVVQIEMAEKFRLR